VYRRKSFASKVFLATKKHKKHKLCRTYLSFLCLFVAKKDFAANFNNILDSLGSR
jgi:hypothetical protein